MARGGGLRKSNIMRLEKALKETLAGVRDQVLRRLWRVIKTGAWLTVHTTTVNCTELGTKEWQDALFL